MYIMASESKVLYIGITNDLFGRTYKHKTKADPNSFTARYNINKLVHFEETDDVSYAIQREKTLKHWKRQWKVDLIEKENPEWEDLAKDWY